MNDQTINNLVVIGSGYEAWLVAASLSCFLQNTGAEISVIGEMTADNEPCAATVGPIIKAFHGFLKLEEEEFIKSCWGSFRLGTHYDSWGEHGQSYFDPFGLIGAPVERADFFACWLKMRTMDTVGSLAHYSIPVQLAEAAKFARPLATEKSKSPLSHFDYGYHFDTRKYQQMLQEHAANFGVEHIEAGIANVNYLNDKGMIRDLELNNGEVVTADIYIDCTGLEGQLIAPLAQKYYDNWEQYFPVNTELTAFVDQFSSKPFTSVSPVKQGWLQTIPLQHHEYLRYCFNADLCADSEAESNFESMVDGKISGDIQILKRKNGVYQKSWVGNCLALGKAAGFVEDLAGYEVTFLLSSISRLFNFFPREQLNEAEIAEYNRETYNQVCNLRDFTLTQLWGRQDESDPFWNQFAHIELPEKLLHKLAVYEQKGTIVKFEHDPFGDASWISSLCGLGKLPKSWDLRADDIDQKKLQHTLSQIRHSVNSVVAGAPLHNQFLTHPAFAAEKAWL